MNFHNEEKDPKIQGKSLDQFIKNLFIIVKESYSYAYYCTHLCFCYHNISVVVPSGHLQLHVYPDSLVD